MALALPAFVVLKSMSNGRYLCPVVGDGQAKLQLSGENVFAPYAKYEVVAAQDGLVHMRCCYNNKYWVRLSEHDRRIAALATEPEGERPRWSCTLFEPIIEAGTVRFRHVQLNGYVSVMPSSDDIEISLEMPGIEFGFIDWGSLFVLPKHVAFKDDRSRYLSARQIKDNWIQYITGNNGHNYLQFTGKDIGDPTVRNDIDVTPDGFVRIMSCGHGKFWRRDPGADWIWADSNNNDLSGDNLFWAVQINDKKIALRNKGNNSFCKRGTGNRLRASVDGIIREAHLEVEETVLSRTIQNVKFRLGDAKVQRKNVDVYVSDDVINNGPTESVEELTFSYSTTRSSTWSSSVSLKLGVGTTVKASFPAMLQGQLEISGEISRTIQWGEEEKTSNKIARKHTVTVPPETTINVIATATVGTFEVPFSYIQSDTLTNGEQVTYRKDDGVYFGENYFEFQLRDTKRKAIQN